MRLISYSCTEARRRTAARTARCGLGRPVSASVGGAPAVRLVVAVNPVRTSARDLEDHGFERGKCRFDVTRCYCYMLARYPMEVVGLTLTDPDMLV